MWACGRAAVMLHSRRKAPASAYRGVSKPSGLRWVAQSRKHHLYKARFPSAYAAASWLAAKLGVTVDSLRWKSMRSLSAESSVPKYEGVRYHPNRGLARWDASHNGQWLGSFKDQDTAAKAIARHRRVGVQTLKLKGKKIGGAFAKRLFRASYKVFREYSPGDYETMVEHEHASTPKAMYEQDFGWQQ